MNISELNSSEKDALSDFKAYNYPAIDQDHYGDSSEYSQLIKERAPNKIDISNLLTHLPPEKTKEDKFVLGIYEENSLVGIIDLVKDFPEKTTWFIGLLLISPEYRSQGVGSKIYRQLKEHLSAKGCEKIMISVAQPNSKGLRFWEKLGFKQVYEKVNDVEERGVNFIYLEDVIKTIVI